MTFKKNYVKNVIMVTPIVDALNRKVPKMIRWCTPSVPKGLKRVKDIYGTDISVSSHSFGNLTSKEGVFAQAQKLAAKAYGADRTLFVVHGTTGSNFIVLSMLAREKPHCKVLTTRNIHKSLLNAAEDYGIDLIYLPVNYDDKWEIFIPPSTKQVKEALKKHKDVHAVILTNPTYEGLSCKLKEIVKVIREHDPKIKIIVDEAWGAHFCFSKKLPKCAMACGVDIAVQSTHKQGGALQQTSMIHAKKKNANLNLLEECFEKYTTTSPAFHLLASLDAAREFMQTQGEKEMDRLINVANALSKKLSKQGLKILTKEICEEWKDNIESIDQTKVLVRVDGLDGVKVANDLEDRFNVVVEKSTKNTILFLTPLQTTMKDVEVTANAVRRLLVLKKR